MRAVQKPNRVVGRLGFITLRNAPDSGGEPLYFSSANKKLRFRSTLSSLKRRRQAKPNGLIACRKTIAVPTGGRHPGATCSKYADCTAEPNRPSTPWTP